jgi:PAS domain S-box-containing protein
MLATMDALAGEPGWERLFWLVFEHTSHPVALLDEGRAIVAVNDAAVSLWGGRREDLVGTSMVDSIKRSERGTSEREWRRFLRSGEYSGERDILRADGELVEIEFAARWALISERRLAVYVATVTDWRPQPRPRLRPHLPLTEREREVATLIALGRETSQIAAELQISPETVRSHVRNSMSKLGVHTRAQLVAVALSAETTLHEAHAAAR